MQRQIKGLNTYNIIFHPYNKSAIWYMQGWLFFQRENEILEVNTWGGWIRCTRFLRCALWKMFRCSDHHRHKMHGCDANMQRALRVANGVFPCASPCFFPVFRRQHDCNISPGVMAEPQPCVRRDGRERHRGLHARHATGHQRSHQRHLCGQPGGHHGFAGFHHGAVQDQGATSRPTSCWFRLHDYQQFVCPPSQGHIVRPKGVAIALMAQYGFMPLIAFCLVKVGKAQLVQFLKQN